MATTPQSTALLDRLSAEIRIEIFRQLYCGQRGLKPCAKKNNTDIALLVALVNDPEKYTEACEVFYGCNNFVLESSRQLENLTSHQVPTTAMRCITHLELVNFNDQPDFLSTQNMQNVISRVSIHLLKLKSFTFACDAVYGKSRQFFDGVSMKDGKLTCTAVGCYTLDCKERFVVQLKHCRLVHCWSELKMSERETLASVEGRLNYDAQTSIRDRNDIYDGFLCSLSLAEWTTVFDANTLASSSSNFGGASLALSVREQDLLVEFRYSLKMGAGTADEVYDAVNGGTSFRDLDMKFPSPEMLEAIGEFLCRIEWVFENILETCQERRSEWLSEGCRKAAAKPS
ncbi:hypothetical protein LTR97_012864 [Elasticomyces elasticus]|uniref:Uncharacterized protein n=1 Tax=Elasticomyces elasticus TaxID=574655 RepID=A0AAN7VV93_9PEZI|nr:hypothetical protein LTR97_012864 [Elasticomyces elasticus]